MIFKVENYTFIGPGGPTLKAVYYYKTLVDR